MVEPLKWYDENEDHSPWIPVRRGGSALSHDADPCEHRRAAEIGDEYERLDHGLPFRQRGFFLRKGSNVCRRVAQRAQLSAVGEVRSGRRIRVTNPGR
jgi:hypothetical protein